MISEKNRALTQQSGDIGYLPVFASHGLGPVLDRLLNAAREEGRTQSQAEATPKGGSVEGWKLVPVEPTELMLHFGDKAQYDTSDEFLGRDVYRAMIAAAPDHPTTAPGLGEPVAWRFRHPGQVYGDGATPGRWDYQETRPDIRPGELWRWEIQTLYALHQSTEQGE